MLRHVRNLTASQGDLEPPVFASDDPEQIGRMLNRLPVIGPTEFRDDDLCILAVGNGAARRKMAGRCPGFITLIAPTAIIDDGIEFSEGTVVCDLAIFTADHRTKIGRHFHCNFHSHVGHDCVIGDFVTLAPKVSVNGNVHIGDDVYVGSGAQIRSGAPGNPIRIGAGAFIAMGAVVTKDVEPGTRVAGNPARPMKPQCAEPSPWRGETVQLGCSPLHQ
jgi:sugar O-acyltransferase (sialic acid O-acetyltransferase NeuD family)